MADFFIAKRKGGGAMREGIKEGDLYEILTVDGKRFEIRYGYYEEMDRISKYNEPIPIYPNFLKNPMYNNRGQPFVTEMQDICKYFEGKMMVDICCGCKYFKKGEDLVGTCLCEKNKIDIDTKGEKI